MFECSLKKRNWIFFSPHESSFCNFIGEEVEDHVMLSVMFCTSMSSAGFSSTHLEFTQQIKKKQELKSVRKKSTSEIVHMHEKVTVPASLDLFPTPPCCVLVVTGFRCLHWSLSLKLHSLQPFSPFLLWPQEFLQCFYGKKKKK